MKIHKREAFYSKAKIELTNSILKIEKDFELTEMELLRLVNDCASSTIASIAKFAIRNERHGDCNKLGGIEYDDDDEDDEFNDSDDPT